MPFSGHFHLRTWHNTTSFRCNRSNTKNPHSRQVTSSPADVENWPFQQKNIQTLIKQKRTTAWTTDLFTHVRGLLYKHINDSGQKFLALIISKSCKYTILVEVHDKLGHQGNTCSYGLIKCHYYWKGMNKDIRKYIANCTLWCKEKAKIQAYLLQVTEILDRPLYKIAI